VEVIDSNGCVTCHNNSRNSKLTISSTASFSAVTINTAISGKIVVQGDKEDI
jgi:hypothetical protein